MEAFVDELRAKEESNAVDVMMVENNVPFHAGLLTTEEEEAEENGLEGARTVADMSLGRDSRGNRSYSLW
jgi:hypothetical protein